MKDFLRQNGILLLVIALLLSILIGVTSALMGGNADPLSNAFNTVTAPIRGGIAAAADWAEGVYEYVFHYQELHDELDELRVQVSELEEQVRQGGFAWGCDCCTNACPYNREPALTPVRALGEHLTPVVTRDNLDALLPVKSYGWRGKATILRNLEIIDEER